MPLRVERGVGLKDDEPASRIRAAYAEVRRGIDILRASNEFDSVVGGLLRDSLRADVDVRGIDAGIVAAVLTVFFPQEAVGPDGARRVGLVASIAEVAGEASG